MYFQSVMIPVKTGNKPEFLDMAAKMSSIFAEHGATRSVECWGEDLMDGKVTDFRRAVQAKDGETVIVGWIEWPDKPTRDRGMAALMQDQRMRATPPAWNGPLAIFGGFTPIHDTAHA